MRAILIDAENGEVKEVEFDGGIDAVHEHIRCRCFTIAFMLNGDVFYVDDEGYLNGTKHFFKLKSLDTQWFAGNCLVVGEGAEGDSVDCSFDLEALRNDVVFMACDDSESCPQPSPMVIVSFD
jgi:hypothetical protein